MSASSVRSPKPPSAHVDDQAAENIPAELRNRDSWVCWAWRFRKGKQKPWDKPPINYATGRNIDETDPVNWLTFDRAREVSANAADGIGFALGDQGQADVHGLVGIDIDGCIDDQGTISPEALELVKRFDSYTERTPSGHGLRILIHGRKRGDECRKPSHKDKFLANIDIYSCTRYLTVTGRILDGTPSAIVRSCKTIIITYNARCAILLA